MSNEYLHLSCDTNEIWVARFKMRIDESPSATLRKRAADWENSPLYEMCLAINTKLAMLDQVVARIDSQLRRLGEQINDEQQLEQCLLVGTESAYQIRDKGVFFQTLVEVDSFLFESRSTYEIVGKFLRGFFQDILRRSLTQNDLQTALAAGDIDTGWIEALRDSRILFVHETAPWIAARVVSKVPLKFELLVLKRNVRDLTNPDGYIEFKRLREIYLGFRSAMPALHRWVEEQIEKFERAEQEGKSQ